MLKLVATRYFVLPLGKSPIVTGVVAASFPIVLGIIFLINGQAFFHNKWHTIHGEPQLHWVSGTPAILGAFFYICVGLYFHFAYYWSQRPRLERFSPILANVALILGLVLGSWGAIAG